MDLFEPTIRCPLRAAVEFISLDWIYDIDASKDADGIEALSNDSEAPSDGRVALSVDWEAQIVLSIPTVIYQK